MIICSGCSRYFSGTPFTLLDNRRICPSCFEGIRSGRGLFPLPNPPKPPEKPGFFAWIFSFHAKQEYQDKMREYDRSKTIYEQEYNRLRKLNSEIEHDICAFWPGGEPPPDWQWRRQRVIEQSDGKCHECGRVPKYLKHERVEKRSRKTKGRMYTVSRFDVHHINPRSKGGTHEFSNLILLCEHCHNKKPKRVTGVSP